ncbi:hypothetical protein H2203_006717 [Taxawa tesnikishii (nom. ined.)]|nr:hypothetical protein H2203_006717 [Dothideales sp. JES 119]
MHLPSFFAAAASVFAAVWAIVARNPIESPMQRSAPPSKQTDIDMAAPAMNAADFRIFNRLAVQMNYYHDILRSSWNELIAGHHDIEEAMWFPHLGRKMEGFRPGHFAQMQHKEMHKGLDVMTEYLNSCRAGERDLVRRELRDIMDSFGSVLWNHLDEEVKELGAENMSKYWTKAEMQRMPF